MLEIPLPRWPRTVKAVLKLPFVDYRDRWRLPQTSAVYFAVINRTSIEYVGSTGNLKQRWGTHHHRVRLAAMGDVTIAYVECEYGPVLWGAEAAAIRQFWPALNLETVQKIKHGYRGLYPRWPTKRWLQKARRERPEDFEKWEWANQGLLKPPPEWVAQHYPELAAPPPAPA